MPPLPLSSTAIAEKNKLATDSVFLICLEIVIPGIEQTIRVVNNTEDITWNSYTWSRMQFELEDIRGNASGEVPRVDIRVDNTMQALEYYIHQYEVWCKNNYRENITCTIYVVNSLNLADPAPEATYPFELLQPKIDERWVTFTLGARNPFNNRYPRHRMIPVCRWKDRGTRCAYAVVDGTICDKTWAICKARGNTLRNGGFFNTGRTTG